MVHPNDQAGRPNLIVSDDTIYLVWKQFEGEQAVVRLMLSHDRGEHFSQAKTIATTKDASDHPILIADAVRVYLSWLTANEGYRLIPLELSE